MSQCARVNIHPILDSVNDKFREAVIVYKSRKQIEKLLEHNRGAINVSENERVHLLTVTAQLLYHSVFSYLCIPLEHFACD